MLCKYVLYFVALVVFFVYDVWKEDIYVYVIFTCTHYRLFLWESGVCIIYVCIWSGILCLFEYEL